ncbi:hypothetical protein SAMN04487899_10832 [Segatella bryantii]|nr:hypothetical protein SAMN04487899_10832 [Segatella bryantii]
MCILYIVKWGSYKNSHKYQDHSNGPVLCRYTSP